MSFQVPGLSKVMWVAAAVAVIGFATLATSCNRVWNELEGHVAFTDRGSDGVSALYMSEANGRHKVMLYRHQDATNSNILFPQWSEDGKQILFTAMKNGKWSQMAIDPHTKKVTETTGVVDTVSKKTRAKDLVVEKGTLFRVQKDGSRLQLHRVRGYDGKFNTGVSEASWSPNLTHVVFQECTAVLGCKIKIARGDGSQTHHISKGASPAWTDLYKKHDADASKGHAKKDDGHAKDKPAEKGAH